VYAESELAIVLSTYYYYVGMECQSIAALEEVGDLEGDTAQWLNYLYNVGAGGIITTGSQEEINAKELLYLEQCLALAREGGYPYFEANALEALSEHGVNSIANAEEALRLFMDYGDVYQTAGAYRTLGTCYHGEGDDSTALYYLSLALEDEKIEQAPDLVASIHEQLSVAYSGVDDKESSDAHRNIYLELQHETRQDLYLQSRAAQYEETARQQKLLMSGVVASIVILVLLLLLFYYLHKRHRRKDSLSVLLEPLREWQREEEHRCTEFAEEMEELSDERGALRVERERNERLSLENRAKLSLVNMTLPLIDRILHEVHGGWSRERIDYIRELTEQINAQNDLLTHWIQLRQGALSLRIESFALQELFDVVSKSKMSFQLKGIRLDVEPTDLTVKADRTLTLFMLNTLADNARKFTGEGGSVKISALRTPTYAEISVSDTGKGMSKETLSHLFEHKVVVDDEVSRKRGENGERSHGFGLMNCRGIIEKYRKMSHIFRYLRQESANANVRA
jgi:signal transduction histidine kinase